MGSRQFVTQCVTNWLGQKERPPIPQIGWVKSFAEGSTQTSREFVEELLTIAGPFLPLLFLLDDNPAYFPVSEHHGRVDRLPSAITSNGERFMNLLTRLIEVGAHIGQRRFWGW